MNVGFHPRLPRASSARGPARCHSSFLRPGRFYGTELSERPAFSFSAASLSGVRSDPVGALTSTRILARTHQLTAPECFPRFAIHFSPFLYSAPPALFPSPLESTLLESPTSADSKQLTRIVSPIESTLTRKPGVGACYC